MSLLLADRPAVRIEIEIFVPTRRRGMFDGKGTSYEMINWGTCTNMAKTTWLYGPSEGREAMGD